MARYINADKVKPDCMSTKGGVAISQSQLANQSTTDVIERSKIDKALKEMDDLASHKVRPISFDQSVAIDMCIDIVKRNIEE